MQGGGRERVCRPIPSLLRAFASISTQLFARCSLRRQPDRVTCVLGVSKPHRRQARSASHTGALNDLSGLDTSFTFNVLAGPAARCRVGCIYITTSTLQLVSASFHCPARHASARHVPWAGQVTGDSEGPQVTRMALQRWTRRRGELKERKRLRQIEVHGRTRIVELTDRAA